MALEEIKSDFADLTGNTKAYVEGNIEYYRLLALKSSSKILSKAILIFMISLLFLMMFLFASFALSYYLGDILRHNLYGFLIVSGIYLGLIILLFLFRHVIITRIVIKWLKSGFFRSEQETEKEDKLVKKSEYEEQD